MTEQAKAATLTAEQIEAQAEVRRGVGGERMVTVRALQRMKDNGHRYAAGDVLHMEISLVPVHILTGQVELVPAAKKAAKK